MSIPASELAEGLRELERILPDCDGDERAMRALLRLDKQRVKQPSLLSAAIAIDDKKFVAWRRKHPGVETTRQPIVIKVYALVDPRTGQHRYVGRTSMTLQMRLAGHLSAARRGLKLQPVSDWVRGLVALGLRPRIELLEKVSPPDASNAERYWMATLRQAGDSLLNFHPGGRNRSRYLKCCQAPN